MSATPSCQAIGTSARTYSLLPHVSIAATGGQTIVLDLKRNRYLGFGHTESLLLAGYVREWPTVEQIGGPPPAVCGTDVEQLLSDMVKNEIVCAGGVADCCANANIATPRVALTSVPEPKIGRHVICAMAASIQTSLKLRLLSLQRVVAHVRRRKNSGSFSGADERALAELVQVYLQVRPFLFTAADECLFDSLALMEFLAKHGVNGTWVIGVTAAPFSAHSWVQCGDIVLNDVPERVLKYTPILAV